MEFKKLAIKNFLSYFETNEIDFAETTTIVIGQNNTGKSKLFDAMNFAIYGRVYDTQKESWTENEKETVNNVVCGYGRVLNVGNGCFDCGSARQSYRQFRIYRNYRAKFYRNGYGKSN